jgi:hypothetical protein
MTLIHWYGAGKKFLSAPALHMTAEIPILTSLYALSCDSIWDHAELRLPPLAVGGHLDATISASPKVLQVEILTAI